MIIKITPTAMMPTSDRRCDQGAAAIDLAMLQHLAGLPQLVGIPECDCDRFR